MLSGVTGGRPIRLPLTFAFCKPERTLLRIMDNSSSLKIAISCKNAIVIGSASDVRQSIVILPIILRQICFSLIISAIRQNCCTDLDSRDGSVMITVSPGCTVFHIKFCCSLMVASPCSYSRHMTVAPAALSSRT